MSKLEDLIQCSKELTAKFHTWNVSETIIDEKRAFWSIQKENSAYQKVSLYRDGHHMFIYGDYGNYVFDSMTWLGSPYNLEYNNLGYQMEKLSRQTREYIREFNDEEFEKDIAIWAEETLLEHDPGSKFLEEFFEEKYSEENEDLNEMFVDHVCSLIKDTEFGQHYALEDFVTEYGQILSPIVLKILEFILDCFEHSEDENEWHHFLRNADTDGFEELFESTLWDAGKEICQPFLISLLALKICGEKLQKQKEETNEKSNGIS